MNRLFIIIVIQIFVIWCFSFYNFWKNSEIEYDTYNEWYKYKIEECRELDWEPSIFDCTFFIWKKIDEIKEVKIPYKYLGRAKEILKDAKKKK